MTLRNRSVIPARVRIAAAAVIFFRAGREAGRIIGWREGADHGREAGAIEGWYEALRPLVAHRNGKVSDAAFEQVLVGPPALRERERNGA
jgi:hypothetical protein